MWLTDRHSTPTPDALRLSPTPSLMPSDPYSILGIDRNASPDDIKKAYRSLSKQWHPDKHKGEKGAEEKFKEINNAYEILSDPKKKQMYDQFGSTGSAGGGAGGFDFSGFQGQDFGGFGDMFEQFFGGQQRGGRARNDQGRGVEVQIEIPFREAVSGVDKLISVETQVSCDSCDGKGAERGSDLMQCDQCAGTGQVTRTAQSFFGAIRQTAVCDHCRGSGKVPEKSCKSCGGEGRKLNARQVTVSVPAGIHDGQSLRLRGEGEAGRQGAEAGDLYVHVRVMPDPEFLRDDDDIRTSVDIPVIDAILGTEIMVNTVQGKVTLKIPAGTQPNQVFRIKGKGMPVLSSSRFGDHYVVANVQVPKKLSGKEKKLLEEWQQLND